MDKLIFYAKISRHSKDVYIIHIPKALYALLKERDFLNQTLRIELSK